MAINIKFKKGDTVRMKEFPEQKGVVTAVSKEMLWCNIGYKGSVPFCKPKDAELIRK